MLQGRREESIFSKIFGFIGRINQNDGQTNKNSDTVYLVPYGYDYSASSNYLPSTFSYNPSSQSSIVCNKIKCFINSNNVHKYSTIVNEAMPSVHSSADFQQSVPRELPVYHEISQSDSTPNIRTELGHAPTYSSQIVPVADSTRWVESQSVPAYFPSRYPQTVSFSHVTTSPTNVLTQSFPSYAFTNTRTDSTRNVMKESMNISSYSSRSDLIPTKNFVHGTRSTLDQVLNSPSFVPIPTVIPNTDSTREVSIESKYVPSSPSVFNIYPKYGSATDKSNAPSHSIPVLFTPYFNSEENRRKNFENTISYPTNSVDVSMVRPSSRVETGLPYGNNPSSFHSYPITETNVQSQPSYSHNIHPKQWLVDRRNLPSIDQSSAVVSA